MPEDNQDIEADLQQIVEMSDGPKCCSGVSMQENLLSDGYCCAKPGNEGCDEEDESGKCAGIRSEKLGTDHLPDEVVVQPATIIVWMTTDSENARRGRHAIGITLGDRVGAILTPQESEYVAAVLQVAANKIKAGYAEDRDGGKGPQAATDFDWPEAGERLAETTEWIPPEDIHCSGCEC